MAKTVPVTLYFVEAEINGEWHEVIDKGQQVFDTLEEARKLSAEIEEVDKHKTQIIRITGVAEVLA